MKAIMSKFRDILLTSRKKKRFSKKLEEIGLSGPDTPKRKETRMDVVSVGACIQCGSKVLC